MKEEKTKQLFKSGTFVSVPLAFYKIKGMTRSYAVVLSTIYSLSQGRGRRMQMSKPRLAEYLRLSKNRIEHTFALDLAVVCEAKLGTESRA